MAPSTTDGSQGLSEHHGKARAIVNHGAVRFTVICDECIRIEYAPGADGRFVDAPSLFAIHGPSGRAHAGADRQVFTTPIDPRLTGHPERFGVPIVIKTARMTLSYTPNGEPPNDRNMFALVEHPSPPPVVPKRAGRVLWAPGAANFMNLGGTLSTLDTLRGPAPLHEGLLSRDGWQLIDDSARPLLIDDWVVSRADSGAKDNIDWYLFAYGTDFHAAFRALAIIAGDVPLPRRYALGSWYSRYWPYASAEFRGIVEEYHAHGFPLDVMVLDMDWHKPGWTGWSWNRELLPDAEELIEWLHAQNLAVTLNLHPADGVGPHEDGYQAFMHALGREADGSTVPFDAGDRRYMESLFKEVHTPLEGLGVGREPRSHGVDFWWLDWQQDRSVRSIPELTNLRWLNHLYTQHSTRPPGTLDPSDPGLRPLCFSRWAADKETNDPGWGDHRHPIHFSGDAHTGWPMLAFQVEFTATAGNVGCFFWSHDIGGHFGPRLEEATARWVQFGALSPALRLHSARSETLDRRPWSYEERFQRSMRAAFRLRAELMPTIYSAVVESCRDTLPLIRSMYIDHPTIDRAYHAPQQYMLGRHLLCAPVVTPGLGQSCVGTQAVWFPPALESSEASLVPSGWHDLISGERFECEGEAIVGATIDDVPVFVRSGVPLATRRFTQRMTTDPIDNLVIRIFPGHAGQTESVDLHEDDGLSLDHTRGRRAKTPITAAWSADERGLLLDLSIGPTIGEFDGQLSTRAITFKLHGVRSSSKPEGHDLQLLDASSFNLDICAGTLEVALPQASIREVRRLRVRVEAVDHAERSLKRRAALLAAAIDAPETNPELASFLGETLVQAAADAHRHEQLLGIGAGIGIVRTDNELRLIDTYGWLDPTHVQAAIIDRVGAHEHTLSEHALTLNGGGTIRSRSAVISLPPLNAPLAMPPIGIRATRLARVNARLHSQSLSFEHEVATHLTPVRAFRAIGPFDWDWRQSILDAVHPPELDRAALAANHTFTGKAGERLSWTIARTGDKWATDLRATFDRKGGLGYAFTVLRSDRKQSARLFIEASDKVEMFLNGRKVYSLDAFDSHAAALGYADVALDAADNLLLIKCSEGGGGWGFTVRVECQSPVTEHSELLSR
jgi:alpha-glucosidase (family GH31 glycosyl hydrolase)